MIPDTVDRVLLWVNDDGSPTLHLVGNTKNGLVSLTYAIGFAESARADLWYGGFVLDLSWRVSNGSEVWVRANRRAEDWSHD